MRQPAAGGALAPARPTLHRRARRSRRYQSYSLVPGLHVDMDSADEHAVYLPAECVRRISSFCLDGEPNPASKLLLLLSMCGVCKNWRQLCSEVAGETALAFDGLETAPPAPGGVMMARFRRTPTRKKTAVFEAAAKLLTGEEGSEWPGAPHSLQRSLQGSCNGLEVRSEVFYGPTAGLLGLGETPPCWGAPGGLPEVLGYPLRHQKAFLVVFAVSWTDGSWHNGGQGAWRALTLAARAVLLLRAALCTSFLQSVSRAAR